MSEPLEYGKMDRNVIEKVGMGSLVPEGHLLWKMGKAVDFGRLCAMADPLYSEDDGRPSIYSVCHKDCIVGNILQVMRERRMVMDINANPILLQKK